MALTIKIYLANKKWNSLYDPTKYGRPSVSYEFSVLLKDGTDVVKPTFIMHLDRGLPEILYRSGNYIECRDLSRNYYIVSRKSVTSTIMEFDCIVDVLASYANKILSTPCFIQYVSRKYNSLIPDDRISLLSTVKQRAITTSIDDFVPLDQYGTYIVQFAAQGSANTARLFALSYSDMEQLLNRIYDKNFFEKVKDSFVTIDALFLSCMYLPIAPEKFGIKDDSIEVFGETLVLCRSAAESISFSLTAKLPLAYESTHDDGNGNTVTDYSHFLNFQPYSKHTILLPYAGIHELNTQPLVDYERNAIPADCEFLISFKISTTTGAIIYYIERMHSPGTGSCITQVIKGMIGKQMPVPYSNSNVMQGIADVTSAVASTGAAIFSPNPISKAMYVGGTIKSIASAIPNLISTSNGATGTIGGQTNYGLLGRDCVVTVTYPDIPPNTINFEYAKVMGAPINTTDTLKNYLPDDYDSEVYVKVFNFFPESGSLTQEEYEMLLDIVNTTKQYTADGFYISK